MARLGTAGGRKTQAPPLTTAQQLGSLIKSARDIMRKDKGLNGDLDRLPMLTWIMFLKFLDDMERIEEERAELAGTDYRPIIEAPYRWRDWAAQADGITGPDLLAFLTAEKIVVPSFAVLAKRRDALASDEAKQALLAKLLRDTHNRYAARRSERAERAHVARRPTRSLHAVDRGALRPVRQET